MLDSCRADRLGTLGYPRATTPRIDRLAADPEATVFARHFAQAPHTKASTASLFTSLYPFEHGVYVEDLLTEIALAPGRFRDRGLPESAATLAEGFRGAGYRTLAAVAIGHLSPASGFAQGFDRYLTAERSTGDLAYLDAALDFLAESTSPAFVYLHLRACHNPFPASRRDAGFLRELAGEVDERRLLGALDVGSLEFKLALRSGAATLDERQRDYLSAVYDSTLRRVDEEYVGHAVDRLRREGLYDRTLLVLSADHGEELLEHGGYAHGHAVWNEIVHVPLVVKFARGGRPPGLPARVERVTETIDLFPALLGAVGAPAPARISGRDLFAGAEVEPLAFAQAPGSWTVVRMPWKVVVDEAARRARLFDLARDPGERADLARERPEKLRELVRVGLELLERAPPRDPAAVSDEALSAETIENLRSLGYLQ
jgi:arylsulfatase A-like enzyme